MQQARDETNGLQELRDQIQSAGDPDRRTEMCLGVPEQSPSQLQIYLQSRKVGPLHGVNLRIRATLESERFFRRFHSYLQRQVNSRRLLNRKESGRAVD